MASAAIIKSAGVGDPLPGTPGTGRKIGAAIIRWTARAGALVLAYIWGAFFVDHLQEWFLHRNGAGFPPWWVWLAMVFHLGMIVGLVLLVRWEITGAIVAVGSTLGFFLTILSERSALWLVLVTLIPVAAIGIARWMGRRR